MHWFETIPGLASAPGLPDALERTQEVVHPGKAHRWTGPVPDLRKAIHWPQYTRFDRTIPRRQQP